MCPASGDKLWKWRETLVHSKFSEILMKNNTGKKVIPKYILEVNKYQESKI